MNVAGGMVLEELIPGVGLEMLGAGPMMVLAPLDELPKPRSGGVVPLVIGGRALFGTAPAPPDTPGVVPKIPGVVPITPGGEPMTPLFMGGRALFGVVPRV